MNYWKRIILSQFFSTLGTTVCKFVLLIWLYELTESSFYVSLFFLSLVLPKVIISPFSAYFVDKKDKKIMLLISEYGEIAVCISIILLYLSGNLNIVNVIIINTIVGMTESFRFPAYSVITTMLLRESEYAKAHGVYMIATSLPSIVGPFIASRIYGTFTIGGTYIMNLLTLIISILLISSIKLEEREIRQEEKISLQDGISTLKNNIIFMFHDASIRSILVICGSYIFAISVIEVILPVLILSEYSNGTEIYGNVEMMYGISALIGALIIAFFGVANKKIHYFFIAAIGAFLGMYFLLFTDQLIICVLGILIYTILNQVMDAQCQSWWQKNIPIKKQGQVFALRRFFIWILGATGSFVAGYADIFSITVSSLSKNSAHKLFMLILISCAFIIVIVTVKKTYRLVRSV